MTLDALPQILLGGLLNGLIYALIAAGLSLIFGLMDVVNFAHGEFLMAGMYLAFGLVLAFAVDPVVLAPLVMAGMFVLGALVYLGVVRHAMNTRANAGMVQVFATFGLAIVLRGLAQFFLSSDYKTAPVRWFEGRPLVIGELSLPLAQVVGAGVSLAAFAGLFLVIARTDFGRALEATREDAGAVALVGIDRTRVFALGWGLGAGLVGVAGAVLASYYYIHPDVGGPFALIAYVVVALGGFGSILGALVAGVIVGVVEALTANLLPPALKSLGIFAVYMAVVVLRPRGLFGSI